MPTEEISTTSSKQSTPDLASASLPSDPLDSSSLFKPVSTQTFNNIYQNIQPSLEGGGFTSPNKDKSVSPPPPPPQTTKDSPLTDIATSPPAFDLTLDHKSSDAEGELEEEEDDFFKHNHNNIINQDQEEDFYSEASSRNTKQSSPTIATSASHTSHKGKDSYESSELSDLGDDDSEAETDKMDFLDDDHTNGDEKVSDLQALSMLTELARLKEVDSDESDLDINRTTNGFQTPLTGDPSNDESEAKRDMKLKSKSDHDETLFVLNNIDKSHITNQEITPENSRGSQGGINEEHPTADSRDNEADLDISINPKENKEAEEEISKHIDQIKDEVAGSTSINSKIVKRSLSIMNNSNQTESEEDENESSSNKKQKNNDSKYSEDDTSFNARDSNDFSEVKNKKNGLSSAHSIDKSIESNNNEENFKSAEIMEDESSLHNLNNAKQDSAQGHEDVALIQDIPTDVSHLKSQAEYEAASENKYETSNEAENANASEAENENENEAVNENDDEVKAGANNEAELEANNEAELEEKHEPEAENENENKREPENENENEDESNDNELEADEEDVEEDDENNTNIKKNKNMNSRLSQEDIDMDEQRKLAIKELVSIESSFAELRDKLYQDKLSLLEHELQLCLEGSHPELSKIYFKINDYYQDNLKLANANLNYNLKCINTETIATRTSIHQDFLKNLMDSKNDMITDTTSLWYKINKERNQLDQLVPDYNFSAIPLIPNVTVPAVSTSDDTMTFTSNNNSQLFNGNGYSDPNFINQDQISQNQHQSQNQLEPQVPLTKKAIKQNTLIEMVQQRNNINHELGILNGLLTFHGFPSAMSSNISDEGQATVTQELLLRKASEDEINADLIAMGIPI